jgi:hypothetical protein
LSLEFKEIYELTISTLVVFFHPPIVGLPSDPIRPSVPAAAAAAVPAAAAAAVPAAAAAAVPAAAAAAAPAAAAAERHSWDDYISHLLREAALQWDAAARRGRYALSARPADRASVRLAAATVCVRIVVAPPPSYRVPSAGASALAAMQALALAEQKDGSGQSAAVTSHGTPAVASQQHQQHQQHQPASAAHGSYILSMHDHTILVVDAHRLAPVCRLPTHAHPFSVAQTAPQQPAAAIAAILASTGVSAAGGGSAAAASAGSTAAGSPLAAGNGNGHGNSSSASWGGAISSANESELFVCLSDRVAQVCRQLSKK